MAPRAMHLLICITRLVALLTADVLSPTARNLPLPQIEEILTLALPEAESLLTESILSNSEIQIAYRGTPNIPLEDISLEVDDIALVNLTDLQLRASPFHMTSVTPDLRLMNLHLHANVSLLEVTGNYTVSIEIMNHTSIALITADKGSLSLTFQNLTVSGLVGLNLNENHLQVHTVDLLYRPNLVVLRLNYRDVKGFPQVFEERSSSVQGSVEEPIYVDLAKRLNVLVQAELNTILRNVTVPELMGNNSETEISFKTSVNNQMGNLNDFVDYILNVTKENIADQIHIPDYVKSFEKKFGFIRIRGSFKAEGGWLRNLTTLHRTADVTLKHVNSSIEVSATVGLSTLDFGYTRYSAKLLLVGPSGRLTATIGRNSVSFRSSVDYTGGNCTVTLQELRVQDIQDVKLSLTGLYPFNWVLSKVATSVTNRSKFNIAKAIEETVGDKIREKLQGFDCGQYFPEPVDTIPEHTDPIENEV